MFAARRKPQIGMVAGYTHQGGRKIPVFGRH